MLQCVFVVRTYRRRQGVREEISFMNRKEFFHYRRWSLPVKGKVFALTFIDGNMTHDVGLKSEWVPLRLQKNSHGALPPQYQGDKWGLTGWHRLAARWCQHPLKSRGKYFWRHTWFWGPPALLNDWICDGKNTPVTNHWNWWLTSRKWIIAYLTNLS